MFTAIYKSLVVTGVLAVVLCGVYPLTVFLTGQLIFSRQANGSLIGKEGKTIGSSLIGQNFSRPEYFHPRPSAAGEKGYDAANSSGSNLGPTSQKLARAIAGHAQRVLSENPGARAGDLPVDLLTASASGLDPHLSIAAAELQTVRIATTRGVEPEFVRGLVAKHTTGRAFGVLGEPVVNVLELNLDLDGHAPYGRK